MPHRPIVALSTALAVTTLASAGCGDVVGVHPDAASLELIPADTLVVEGDTASLAVRVLDAAGNALEPLPDGERPRWGGTPGILEPLGPGRFLAVGAGEAVVTVEYATLEASARVRVNAATVEVSVGAAYLVQVVQRRDGGVPLVGGRGAVARVFPTADRPNFFSLDARLTFYHDAAPVHSVTLSGSPTGVPLEVDEGVRAYEAPVPADLVRPGLGIVVDLDPDSRLPTPRPVRWPAAGIHRLDVHEAPPFSLRIVPVRADAHNTTGRITPSSAPDFSRLLRDILPVADFQVDVGSTHTTSARLDTFQGWAQLLHELIEFQENDPEPRYYYAAVHLPDDAITRGLSHGTGTRTAAGSDADPAIMAHEIGHTFGLGHTPACSAAFDEDYPYPHGSIGHWGYNPRTAQLVPPSTRDFMGCAGDLWISDYHYLKTLDFRAANDDLTPTTRTTSTPAAPPAREAVSPGPPSRDPTLPKP